MTNLFWLQLQFKLTQLLEAIRDGRRIRGAGRTGTEVSTATGGNKISARPERVEGFQRKSGLIHRRYGSTGFVHPEHDEGLNERMKAFSVSRRRYGSTSSPRTAWRIIYPSPATVLN